MEIVNFTWLPSFIGGSIIGLSVSILYIFRGNMAGISGIYAKFIEFDFPDKKSNSLWRYSFIFGLLLAPIIINFSNIETLGFTLPVTNFFLVMLGGLLVGYGTQLGSGCTSGHGICGISRFSIRSIVGTCSFMLTGIVTVFITSKLGFL